MTGEHRVTYIHFQNEHALGNSSHKLISSEAARTTSSTFPTTCNKSLSECIPTRLCYHKLITLDPTLLDIHHVQEDRAERASVQVHQYHPEKNSSK